MSQHSMCVLVVEPTEELRRATECMLRLLFHHEGLVLVASIAEARQHLAQGHTFDLVLCSADWEHESGTDLLKVLRQSGDAVAFVLTSSNRAWREVGEYRVYCAGHKATFLFLGMVLLDHYRHAIDIALELVGR